MSKATVKTDEQAPEENPKPAGFRKTVGPHRVAAENLKVPELFKRWSEFKGQGRPAQFAYLTERMEELANAGALSVTHIHGQPVPIPDYCGMIVFGREFTEASNEIQSATMPIGPALRDYKVEVRSIKRDVSQILGNDKLSPKAGVPERVPLGWKVGKQSGRAIRSRPGEHHQGFVTSTRMQDVYMESDIYEGTIPIVDAWRMLHQHGKHCVSAPTPSRQARMWLYEEVIPEAANRPPSEDPGFAAPKESDAPHMRRTVH